MPPFDTVALEKAALEHVQRALFEACMSDTPAEEIDGWIELRCEELVDYIRPFIKLRSMNIGRQIAFDRLARHKKQSRAEPNAVKRELTRRLDPSDEWKARWETDFVANWETEWRLTINTVSKAYDIVPAYSVMAKRDELPAEFRSACADQIMP